MGSLKREIDKTVKKSLFQGKVIVIYGARQVGKTTLIKRIRASQKAPSIMLNCDEPDIRRMLTNRTSTELERLVQNKKLVLIDEAQRVKNIGLTLKLFADNLPETQVIATGSSSFELSNEISEPLTGRADVFELLPFSLKEISQRYSNLEIDRQLEERIVFGMYPEVLTRPERKKRTLQNITKNYLYKDVLEFEDIKYPELLEKLLSALALRIGNEVSYNELANLLDTSKQTIRNYIRILEQAFIIFRLRPFSRNLRKELSRKRKVYFYDTGVRNALIRNFNPLELRQDVGSLWENFILSELYKKNNNREIQPNTYFWRTHDQQEIDYLEEIGGELNAYEIKWKKTKKKIPSQFRHTYPESSTSFITKENYLDYLV